MANSGNIQWEMDRVVSVSSKIVGGKKIFVLQDVKSGGKICSKAHQGVIIQVPLIKGRWLL